MAITITRDLKYIVSIVVPASKQWRTFFNLMRYYVPGCNANQLGICILVIVIAANI